MLRLLSLARCANGALGPAPQQSLQHLACVPAAAVLRTFSSGGFGWSRGSDEQGMGASAVDVHSMLCSKGGATSELQCFPDPADAVAALSRAGPDEEALRNAEKLIDLMANRWGGGWACTWQGDSMAAMCTALFANPACRVCMFVHTSTCSPSMQQMMMASLPSGARNPEVRAAPAGVWVRFEGWIRKLRRGLHALRSSLGIGKQERGRGAQGIGRAHNRR